MDFHRDEPQPQHLREIWEAIHQLERQQAMSQTEIDALTTAVGQVAADLEADINTVQTELDTLETEVREGQTPDLSALSTAVAALDPKAKALGALTAQTTVENAEAKVDALIEVAPTTVYAFTPSESAKQVETMVPSGYTTAGFETLYSDIDTTAGDAIPDGYSVYPGPVRAVPSATKVETPVETPPALTSTGEIG
jgi:hypothetical protein